MESTISHEGTTPTEQLHDTAAHILQPISLPGCLESLLEYADGLEDVETAYVDLAANGQPLVLIAAAEGVMVVSCSCFAEPDRPCEISISDITVGDDASDDEATFAGDDAIPKACRYIRSAVARYSAAE